MKEDIGVEVFEGIAAGVFICLGALMLFYAFLNNLIPHWVIRLFLSVIAVAVTLFVIVLFPMIIDLFINRDKDDKVN